MSDKQEMYIKTLESSAGYTCECLQTLRFEFVNISELRTCLSTADKYSGNILVVYIIFTLLLNIYFSYFINLCCRSNINESTYS